MPQILDAGELDGGVPAEPRKPTPGRRFAWENLARFIVIAGVLTLVALLSWRPAMLRFSQLMFLVAPSHGDSLAWRPEPDAGEPLPERRHTLAPAEWRLTASNFGGWKLTRQTEVDFDQAVSGAFLVRDWRRNSFNPWTWQDDVPFAKKRSGGGPAEPEAQPLSSFRVKDSDVWEHRPTPTETPSQPEAVAAAESPAPRSDGLSMPSLSPVPLEIPSLKSSSPPTARTDEETSPEIKPDLLELPPLSFDDIDIAGLGWDTPEEKPGEKPEPDAKIEPETKPEPETKAEPEEKPTEPTPAPEPAPAVTVSNDPKPDGASPAGEDWANAEITRPIPGAYLTIYPKLKFIGLCVPGHGYIRKYNQVAVPRDTAAPKFGAHDGRTPYGKYYVAGRNRGARGPELSLSWPSPEDSRRIGLPPEQIREIEDAWLGQRVPPQDTVAGGGLTLSGDREKVEETDGGFSLEVPHMEEIFTALPDGAWVFVQQ